MCLSSQSFRVWAEVDVDLMFPPTSTFALSVAQLNGAFVISRETFGFLSSTWRTIRDRLAFALSRCDEPP
jgi:hypothetical protein